MSIECDLNHYFIISNLSCFFLLGTKHFSLLFSGGPMDHNGPMPMVNDFGNLTPESNFLNQQGGPGSGADHILSGGGGPRGGSPEFMSSGNFSEPQNMQNEGLVW